MIDTTAGPIPARYIEFCKEVATLARARGFGSVALTIRPGFYEAGEAWRDPVQMNWEQGRHGDSSKNMAITSTVMIRADLDASEEGVADSRRATQGADHEQQ